MNDLLSEQRQIDNEVVFRQANERVQSALAELKSMAKTEHYNYLPKQSDAPIHFYCECSDENCKKRIIIKPSLYKEIHTSRKRFLIKPSHGVPSIERIVFKESAYTVVEKFTTPPETAEKLQVTNIVNVLPLPGH